MDLQLCYAGTSDFGQCSAALPRDPSTGGPVSLRSVSGGFTFTALLSADSGTVFTAGVGFYGELGRESLGEGEGKGELRGRGHVHGEGCDGRYRGVVGGGGDGGGHFHRSTALMLPVALPQSAGRVSHVACGFAHVLVACEEGGLWAWGWNKRGQLGINSMEDVALSPRRVAFAAPSPAEHPLSSSSSAAAAASAATTLPHELSNSTFVSVACGESHSLAVTRGGEAYSWGGNAYGQLGIDGRAVAAGCSRCGGGDSGSGGDSGCGGDCGCGGGGGGGRSGGRGASVAPKDTRAPWEPVTFPPRDGPLAATSNHTNNSTNSSKVTSVAAGWYHSAAVVEPGRPFTFGFGLYLQLGHGDTANQPRPREVESLRGVGPMLPATGESVDVVKISCGAWHTVALTPTGSVYVWGWHGLAHGDGALHGGGAGGGAGEAASRNSPLPALVPLWRYGSGGGNNGGGDGGDSNGDGDDDEPVAVDVCSGAQHFVIRTSAGALFSVGPSDGPEHSVVTARTRTHTVYSTRADGDRMPTMPTMPTPRGVDGRPPIADSTVEKAGLVTTEEAASCGGTDHDGGHHATTSSAAVVSMSLPTSTQPPPLLVQHVQQPPLPSWKPFFSPSETWSIHRIADTILPDPLEDASAADDGGDGDGDGDGDGGDGGDGSDGGRHGGAKRQRTATLGGVAGCSRGRRNGGRCVVGCGTWNTMWWRGAHGIGATPIDKGSSTN